MKTLEVASLAVVLVLAAGCGRTGTICETAVDCSPGQVCTADGCVFLDGGGRGGGAGGGIGGGGSMGGGLGGGVGGGLGGGMGGGAGGGMGGGTTGGGLGGGAGGGTGGGGSTCRPGETQCPSGCKNLSLDLDNCGACARPCPEAANGRATCSAGICGLTCSAGFADCDGNPLNGCEANFNDPSTCGSCRNVCPAGPNSIATCSMGACGLSCRPGFGNCDFFAPNGCETDLSLPTNCGTCGNVCRTGPNQSASCTMGQCSAQCLPNFADCDGLPATGCEANLTSATSCGSCMNVCPTGGPNTVATCSGTTCGVQCRPGFGDCDGLPATGCEADLNSDATCGSCTTACMPGVSCVGGICGGQMCPAPAVGVLTLNTTVTGTLPAGASSGRFPVPTCSTQSTRYEDLWTFTLAAANTVTFETGGTVDTVLYVRANCTANTDLACNDDTPGLGTLSRVSLMLQPGTYSVFVKQWGTNNMTGGAYSLTATLGAPVTNASCQTPMQLTSGVPVLAQDTRSGTTISTACLPGQGVQLFYRLLVPPNQRATITVTPRSGASMTARLINTCNATSCLGSAQGTTPQVLTFDNRNGFTQNLIIAVGATVLGMNGTFDLRADLGPIPSSLNTTCATATPLSVNGPSVSGEFIDLGGPALTSCLPGQAGRVLYYSVVVPGRQAVQVTASSIGFDVGLRLFNACAQVGTCAAFADNAVGVGAEFLRITNPASTPQMYIVVASSSAVGTGGQFSISAFSANPFAANNAFCDTPTVLPSGVAIAGELELPGGLPLHNVCLPSSAGYTRYYAVSVPQSSTLQAMATPAAVSGIDVGVRVLSGCAATSCFVSSDVSQLSSSSGAESAVVTNLSGAPQTYLVAVSGVNTVPSTSAAYNVIANVMPTAPNAVCAGATPMTVGLTVMDSLGAGGAATTPCLPAANGLSKYYRITVAPSERLAITGSPSNFNLALRLLDGCTATSCAASSDASPSITGAEQVTVQNDTTTPKDYVIVVSGGGAATPSSSYTLSVQRASYRVADLTASCDDLSLAPELLGPTTMPAISDDAASLVVPLPAGFAFQFFRTPVTHYSACVNGFAQLHSSAAGVSNTSFGNVAMPNSAQPNWLLAPFWDDLAAAPTTRVRSQVQGTAPNRVFTIEWFDAALNVGATAGVERMRFQTRLFETTNVVEFHYCSLSANGGSSALVSGGSATIGIESGLGTEAVQRSFNTAGSVSTGQGVRFTPQ